MVAAGFGFVTGVVIFGGWIALIEVIERPSYHADLPSLLNMMLAGGIVWLIIGSVLFTALYLFWLRDRKMIPAIALIAAAAAWVELLFFGVADTFFTICRCRGSDMWLWTNDPAEVIAAMFMPAIAGAATMTALLASKKGVLIG